LLAELLAGWACWQGWLSLLVGSLCWLAGWVCWLAVFLAGFALWLALLFGLAGLLKL
jgi:hypothetical protein